MREKDIVYRAKTRATRRGVGITESQDWQEAAREITRLRAALAAAEVKPRAVTLSDMLAEELKTWAEDERASWPKDTAYQDDLADLLAQLSALEGE